MEKVAPTLALFLGHFVLRSDQSDAIATLGNRLGTINAPGPFGSMREQRDEDDDREWHTEKE